MNMKRCFDFGTLQILGLVLLAFATVASACGSDCVDCGDDNSGRQNGSGDMGQLGKIDGADGSPSSPGFECISNDCEIEILANVAADDAAVVSGWVYYEKGQELYRVPLDGSREPSLVMQHIGSDLESFGDALFTTNGGSGSRSVVWVDGPSGAHETLPVECGGDIGVNSSALYVEIEEQIYRVPTDGSAARSIAYASSFIGIQASERWVCWEQVYEIVRCTSADGSPVVRFGQGMIVSVDDDYVYYVDGDGNLRRGHVSSGEIEMVWSNADGRNQSYQASHADSRYLYWTQTLIAHNDRERVNRLEKATGIIEAFGFIDVGSIVGGDDNYLILESPLRRVRK